MNETMTAAEIEQRHKTVLGASLGPLYHALHNEVTWLHVKWLQYRKLYATSAERVDHLNETAGFFFRVVQDVLWEDILLHIARLMDTPGGGKESRLVLIRLKGQIKDRKAASEVRTLLAVANSRVEFARQWRNRRLAHRDLLLAINDPTAHALPGARLEDVEAALSSFRDILNVIHKEYLGSEFAFDQVIVSRDADALAHHLVSLKSSRQKMERFKSGRTIREDHEP